MRNFLIASISGLIILMFFSCGGEDVGYYSEEQSADIQDDNSSGEKSLTSMASTLDQDVKLIVSNLKKKNYTTAKSRLNSLTSNIQTTLEKGTKEQVLSIMTYLTNLVKINKSYAKIVLLISAQSIQNESKLKNMNEIDLIPPFIDPDSLLFDGHFMPDKVFIPDGPLDMSGAFEGVMGGQGGNRGTGSVGGQGGAHTRSVGMNMFLIAIGVEEDTDGKKKEKKASIWGGGSTWLRTDMTVREFFVAAMNLNITNELSQLKF